MPANAKETFWLDQLMLHLKKELLLLQIYVKSNSETTLLVTDEIPKKFMEK